MFDEKIKTILDLKMWLRTFLVRALWKYLHQYSDVTSTGVCKIKIKTTTSSPEGSYWDIYRKVSYNQLPFSMKELYFKFTLREYPKKIIAGRGRVRNVHGVFIPVITLLYIKDKTTNLTKVLLKREKDAWKEQPLTNGSV